jgi:transcription initiation factor TFIID subunit 6
MSYRRVQTNTGTIYVLEDEEIDLTKVLKARLPEVPMDVTYTGSYLFSFLLSIKFRLVLLQLTGSRSKEFNLRFHKTPLQQVRYSSPFSHKSHHFMIPLTELKAISQASHPQLSKTSTTTTSTTIRPLVRHTLSKELQLYFTRLTGSALSNDGAARMAAVSSLESDSGLHQLVPYLCKWFATEVSFSRVRRERH